MKYQIFNGFFIYLILLLSVFSYSCKKENDDKAEQFSGGKGTQNDPYLITTSEQLKKFAKLINDGEESYIDKHYKLGNDIDLTEYDKESNARISWTPIGWYQSSSNRRPFRGVFDGNKKKISGLYIRSESLQYTGLFGYVQNCTIKNLSVIDVDIYITYSKNLSESSKGFYVGAIVGYNNKGLIYNCYSTGKVENYVIATNTGSFAGGIAGYNSIDNILNCYSSCSVSSSANLFSYSGGIAGYNTGMLSNCYSIGSTYSSVQKIYSISGGIIGYNEGSVSNCAALISSVSCIGPEKKYGRIVGNNDGTLSSNIAFIDIINPDKDTNWDNIGENQIDGENFSIEQIYTDGALGGRFTIENEWTVQNGKLPGLFGNTVDMPKHLIP